MKCVVWTQGPSQHVFGRRTALSGRLRFHPQVLHVKHMSEVGIRGLKQNASAVVAEAAAGEKLTITERSWLEDVDRDLVSCDLVRIELMRAVRRIVPCCGAGSGRRRRGLGHL